METISEGLFHKFKLDQRLQAENEKKEQAKDEMQEEK
jgi:hypothetical protein